MCRLVVTAYSYVVCSYTLFFAKLYVLLIWPVCQTVTDTYKS